MKTNRKKDFSLAKIRRFLEPGPIVLVSSAHKGARNIMTLGWHMMLGFEPALVGCYIWDENHSFSLIRRSKECVINIPTFDLVDAVIEVGNHHGPDVDKFEQYGLTPVAGTIVDAPLIAECFANFECKMVDTSLINRYGLFVFEVVKAHVAKSPRYRDARMNDQAQAWRRVQKWHGDLYLGTAKNGDATRSARTVVRSEA